MGGLIYLATFILYVCPQPSIVKKGGTVDVQYPSFPVTFHSTTEVKSFFSNDVINRKKPVLYPPLGNRYLNLCYTTVLFHTCK